MRNLLFQGPSRGLCLVIGLALVLGCRQEAEPDPVPIVREPNYGVIAKRLAAPRPLRGEPAGPWKLDERMQHYQVPGLSIAVIEGGAIIWQENFGVRAAGQPDPITAETTFQAGTASTLVTAHAALLLVQKGALVLEERIDRVGAWRVQPPQRDRPVTLDKLLTHRGGLNVRAISGRPEGGVAPTALDVLLGQPPADNPRVVVTTPPGRDSRFSSGGYALIEQLIKDQGKTLPELAQEEIFEPLGLQNSGYERREGMAAGHLSSGEAIVGQARNYPPGVGGLYSTASDLARLLLSVYRSAGILQPADFPDGEVPPLLATRLGSRFFEPRLRFADAFEVSGRPPNCRFQLSGLSRGFRTLIAGHCAQARAVVVMTNGERGLGLAEEIVQAAAEVLSWSGFDPVPRTTTAVADSQLVGLVGRYRLEGRGKEFGIVLRDGSLVLEAEEGAFEGEPASRAALLPLGASSYFFRERPEDILFQFNGTDPARSFLLRNETAMRIGGGTSIEAVDSPVDDGAFQDPVGDDEEEGEGEEGGDGL